MSTTSPRCARRGGTTLSGSAVRGADRRAGGRRQHHDSSARGPAAHPGPRRAACAGRAADAAEPGDGGERGDGPDRDARSRPRTAASCRNAAQEVTTEGGLDVAGQEAATAVMSADASARPGSACRCSSIPTGASSTPRPASVRRSSSCTRAPMRRRAARSRRANSRALADAARYAASLGLTVHAGHGLHYHNVQPIAAIPEIVELNIGHAIVARAVIDGMALAVAEMKRLMLAAREPALIFGIGTDVVQHRAHPAPVREVRRAVRRAPADAGRSAGAFAIRRARCGSSRCASPPKRRSSRPWARASHTACGSATAGSSRIRGARPEIIWSAARPRALRAARDRRGSCDADGRSRADRGGRGVDAQGCSTEASDAWQCSSSTSKPFPTSSWAAASTASTT